MTCRPTPDNRLISRKNIANLASVFTRSFLWERSHARLSAVALLLGCAAPASRAAIFQTDHWALSGEAEAGVGYDSNLFARSGSDGDGYGLVAPAFTLQRLNSLTGFDSTLTIKSYSYFDRTDLDSIDPKLSVKIRYPADEEVLATQEVDVNASRSTDANSNIGTRLRHDDFYGHWEGSFSPTGKLTILTRTTLQRTAYLTPGFNTNDSAAAGLTLDLVSNEKLQLGAGYDYIYSRSKPANETESRQQQYTFRGRGEFLPKITGNFYAGIGYSNYTGAYTQTSWTFVAGASLSWQITERAQLTLVADRSTDFAPGGAALTHSGLGLEWSQQLAGGFTATLGVDGSEVVYRFGTDTQHFHEYGGHFQLRYALTERLAIVLNTTYAKQNSDEFFANFDRGTVYASVNLKF